MIRVIDRAGNKSVQKVTKPDGSLVRYQTVVENNGVITVLNDHDTLLAARRDIGRVERGQPCRLSQK